MEYFAVLIFLLLVTNGSNKWHSSTLQNAGNIALFISMLQMSIFVVCLYIKFDFSRCLLHVIPSHYTQLSAIDMNWSRIYLYIDRFHPIVESPLNEKKLRSIPVKTTYGRLKSQWCIYNMTPCCQPFFEQHFESINFVFWTDVRSHH